jgi:hypothetical protein
MFTAASVITKAPGKKINLSGRSGCKAGNRVTGFSELVKYNQGKISGHIGEGGLQILASGKGGVEGVFVPFEPGKATLGELSGAEGFFVSDQFGGCDFTILKNPQGQWAGAHVYSNDACRAAIAATPEGWTNVYTWRSGPYARRYGMSGSILVICFVTKISLKFVMVRVEGLGVVKDAVLSAHVRLGK